MAQFIPPNREKGPHDYGPRAGVAGSLIGILIGTLVCAIAFWLTDSYWWSLSIPGLAWIGYVIRLSPPLSSQRRKFPRNVLW